MAPKKAPASTLLDPKSNQEVTSQTSHICATTTRVLLPTDIQTSFELGGGKAIFTQDEMKQMRDFGKPCMHLLGFREALFLKSKLNVKPSVFVVPDDEVYDLI